MINKSKDFKPVIPTQAQHKYIVLIKNPTTTTKYWSPNENNYKNHQVDTQDKTKQGIRTQRGFEDDKYFYPRLGDISITYARKQSNFTPPIQKNILTYTRPELRINTPGKINKISYLIPCQYILGYHVIP